MTNPPIEPLPLRDPYLAGLLTWLIPGLGQLYQGRIAKGLIFFFCVLGLFFAGFQQGNWRIVYFRWDQTEWRYHYLAQAATGLVALPAMLPAGAARRWLPEQWRWFQAAPGDIEMDDLHRELGKKIDIALVYTMIAGLLNVLAIYDAVAGPAWWNEEQQWYASRSGEPQPAPEAT